jgi:hypothetical protein
MNIGQILTVGLETASTLAADTTELIVGQSVATPIVQNVASLGGKAVNVVVIAGENVNTIGVAKALAAINGQT